MRVLLLRHGLAGERDPICWPDDRARPLTPKGEQRTSVACDGLVRLEPKLARIVTSPLVRAARTAELLRECCAVKPKLERLDALAPGGSWRAVLAHLEAAEPDGPVVLVGHEPDLGKLAGTLLFGAPAAIPFKKAGACCIEFESRVKTGEGQLRWLLPPRMLRRFARRRSRA